MEYLKEEIVKRFVSRHIMVYLLDELEVYWFDDKMVIAEFWSPNKATLYVGKPGEIDEVYEVDIEEGKKNEAIFKFLKDRFNVERLEFLPILDKLKWMMKLSLVNIVIRDKEETRGGELVELTLALTEGLMEKTWLFARKNISISSMVDSLLLSYHGHKMDYTDQEDLLGKCLQLIRSYIYSKS